MDRQLASALFSKLARHLKLAGQGTRDERPERPALHGVPMPSGDSNENPRGIGLLALLAEDLRTHGGSLREPGFWAIAVHRFGNARMGVRKKALRAPLSLAYRTMFTGVTWCWGIDLSYTVKLGRRVRIWHRGSLLLGARAIGDDVQIGHNVTFGVADRRLPSHKPIIGNRVSIGSGACVLGAVTIGDGCTIGPNSVVVRDLPGGTSALGVPARPVQNMPRELWRMKP
jgi:serine O-acetyltransferase